MKILAYTSPARGHLYPLVPILMSWLPAATRSPSGRWRQKIELMAARGFDAAPRRRRLGPMPEAGGSPRFRG